MNDNMDAKGYLDAYDHLHRRIAQAGDWAARQWPSRDL